MSDKWKIIVPIIILSALGVGFIIYGLKDILIPRAPEVEIIKAETALPSPIPSRTIVVDVSGAVENPGVYTLPFGSRISDCLVAAGGLSVVADKNYLARYVNLASVVPDGAKIYILKKGESPILPSSTPAPVLGENTNPASSNLISINSASQSDLETLWGIGPSRAKSIYDHRPYTSLEEIKSKADIPDNVYQEIKDQITL